MTGLPPVPGGEKAWLWQSCASAELFLTSLSDAHCEGAVHLEPCFMLKAASGLHQLGMGAGSEGGVCREVLFDTCFVFSTTVLII